MCFQSPVKNVVVWLAVCHAIADAVLLICCEAGRRVVRLAERDARTRKRKTGPREASRRGCEAAEAVAGDGTQRNEL